MFKAKVALVTVVASLFFLPQSFAGILIEPYLGYHMAKSKQSGSADNSAKGISFGGRLGYENFLGLMVGGDYQAASWSDDASPKDDLKLTNMGVFVGYEFPVLLRVYGTYIFSSKNKISSSDGGITEKGSGFKLGVGFTTLPLISINLEYGVLNYDKYEGNTLGGPSSGTFSDKAKATFYGLTVSVPFDL